MYELLMLISSPTATGLQPLLDAVRAEYAAHKDSVRPDITIDGDRATITVKGFRFVIDYVCGAHVKTESAEISEHFGTKHPEKAVIATASCRYELRSDADPGMDHFNDMVFISTAAASLPGVFVFDPAAGMFL